jgi:hypothetical protein
MTVRERKANLRGEAFIASTAFATDPPLQLTTTLAYTLTPLVMKEGYKRCKV